MGKHGERTNPISLLGIDVGSSSVKAGAYNEQGELLAVTRVELTPQHPQPGWWEQDPEQVWHCTGDLIRALMQEQALKRDPPVALAVSASVRENFPADAEGNPLATCIMAGDVRGAEFEISPEGVSLPEAWSFSCGHMRERMDPFNRLLYWRRNHPEVMRLARYFIGWHEFLTLRMCGRAVADETVAGRWLIFDLASQRFSMERLAEYGVEADILPEILPWGTVIGEVKKELVEAWGIPGKLKMAVGASDLNCAGLGAGASAVGDACMVSGSFENLLIPTSEFPSATMLLRGLSVTPHPGSAGRAVWAICPTGTAVLNWSRGLMNLSIDELDHALNESDPSPSAVLAVPYLSGAFIFWPGGRKLRGTLFGLTLATSQIDIIRAFMESIAYDHVNTLTMLSQEGVNVERVKAMGGGSRSVWWTQLKSDMMGIPIEVIRQPEAGTLGAALLAGLAVGIFDDLGNASREFAGSLRSHEPNAERAALHDEKLEQYRAAVEQLLTVY